MKRLCWNLKRELKKEVKEKPRHDLETTGKTSHQNTFQKTQGFRD